jgi:hypothetical protein
MGTMKMCKPAKKFARFPETLKMTLVACLKDLGHISKIYGFAKKVVVSQYSFDLQMGLVLFLQNPESKATKEWFNKAQGKVADDAVLERLRFVKLLYCIQIGLLVAEQGDPAARRHLEMAEEISEEIGSISLREWLASG